MDLSPTPHLNFFIFCAIQCVGDTAFAKRLGDHLWWYVVPGITDSSADLVKPDLANATPGCKAVLSCQHPVLPLCLHAVLEGLVNGHIQRLKHAGHVTRNHNALCIDGPQGTVNWFG